MKSLVLTVMMVLGLSSNANAITCTPEGAGASINGEDTVLQTTIEPFDPLVTLADGYDFETTDTFVIGSKTEDGLLLTLFISFETGKFVLSADDGDNAVVNYGTCR